MEYLADNKKMKEIDRMTIEEAGIPSLVLMERAALSVVMALEEKYGKEQQVLCVCGTGNNGADGIAAARILSERGHNSTIYIPKESEHATEEWKKQLSTAEYLKIPVLRKAPDWSEYTVLVDAVFGVGLSREVEGSYKETIEEMNASRKPIVAVDIPSGICGRTGQILGSAVRAELTVTFGLNKTGLVRYPGAEYAGEIRIENPGFPKSVIDKCGLDVYTYTGEDLKKLPERPCDGNKGTFQKIAVLAGTKNMAGAAYLSAMAAYRMGAGLVRICTCEENRSILQVRIPEAVLTTYREDNVKEQAEQVMEWADVIIAGPGLGQSETAEELILSVLTYAAKEKEKPVVIDADGLNLLTVLGVSKEKLQGNLYLTPHPGEFSRLTGRSVAELKKDLERSARDYVKEHNVCLVCKDARTIVVSQKEQGLYMNQSGCNGMATAGSGDVLTGVLAGMLAMGLNGQQAAAYAVYFHGLAGERAAKRTGNHALCATDMLDGIAEVWHEIESSKISK